MAVNEGIGSPFPAQPSVRSSKVRTYESLFLLNQGMDQVIVVLRRMERFTFADKESLRSAQGHIEEVRAGINADFVEKLGQRERSDEGRFWKRRRSYEDKLKDPDDVYLSVVAREKERKKQGLPPRVGIIPPSAVVQEEERWNTQQEQKRTRKRRK